VGVNQYFRIRTPEQMLNRREHSMSYDIKDNRIIQVELNKEELKIATDFDIEIR
jgi:hypothetical protein